MREAPRIRIIFVVEACRFAGDLGKMFHILDAVPPDTSATRVVSLGIVSVRTEQTAGDNSPPSKVVVRPADFFPVKAFQQFVFLGLKMVRRANRFILAVRRKL